MFSRKSAGPARAAAPAAKARNGAPGLSFIGPEMVVGGDVTTTAQLHVEGRIDGDVRCGQLCQGGSGVIAGNIVAEEARIAGLIEGRVEARTVIVEASARIVGDVAYQTLSIAAGARIDGRLSRGDSAEGDTKAAPVLIASPAERKPKDGLFADPAEARAAAG